MENKKTGALAYLFGAAVSLIMLLAVIKFMGVPLTWFAVFLPLFAYLAFVSFLMLVGSIAGVIVSIKENMRG